MNLLDSIDLSSYLLASRLICGQNGHPLGQNARPWGNLPLTAMKFKLIHYLHDLLTIQIKAWLISDNAIVVYQSKPLRWTLFGL